MLIIGHKYKGKRYPLVLFIQKMAAQGDHFSYEAGKLTTSRRYDLGTFAAVKPWRVGRELAV